MGRLDTQPAVIARRPAGDRVAAQNPYGTIDADAQPNWLEPPYVPQRCTSGFGQQAGPVPIKRGPVVLLDERMPPDLWGDLCVVRPVGRERAGR